VVTQVVYVSVTLIETVHDDELTTSDPIANPTTLNAQGQGRVIYITGGINPTIEGLRITGGSTIRDPNPILGFGRGLFGDPAPRSNECSATRTASATGGFGGFGLPDPGAAIKVILSFPARRIWRWTATVQ
jgi:hypothetical protein